MLSQVSTARCLVMAAMALAAAGPCCARGAEIRLKAHSAPAGAMVTLGDVADIFASDSAEAERLRAIELFPAPPPGRERFVRARELRDLLLLRGVNLADHRFSGASQMTVTGSGPVVRASAETPVTVVHTRRAHSRIAEALKAHLMARVSAETPWLVEAELSDSLIRTLADPATELRIEGGRPPWVGLQQFDLRLTTPDGPQHAVVEARVSIPASIVVAARSLPRGVVLRAADIELRHAESPMQQQGSLYTLDQAIGKETTRSIPAGKILTADAVQAPVYVRRGEIVTVYAHAAGIRIRTQGRARDEGSDGALVAVETLDTREMFFARVCGVREVEVFARAARAADSPQPGGLTTRR